MLITYFFYEERGKSILKICESGKKIVNLKSEMTTWIQKKVNQHCCRLSASQRLLLCFVDIQD